LTELGDRLSMSHATNPAIGAPDAIISAAAKALIAKPGCAVPG
jgi:hypothetical protein